MAVGFPKCGILATEWANLVFANRNVKALWLLLLAAVLLNAAATLTAAQWSGVQESNLD